MNTFKREREEMEEKFKAIKLYFEEREIINGKFEDIYSKIITFIDRN